MSSSKKKQLRKEQYMTERQNAAAQEAKKLKRYTLTFWVVIAVVVCVFVGAVVSNPLKNMIYKNTNAIKVGDHVLSSVDVNYYYMDAVSDYQQSVYNQYYSMLGNSWSIALGFDPTKPLDEQVLNQETGATWADNFMETAKNAIKSNYALYDLAVKNGHKLTEDEQKSIDSTLATYELYAYYYGHKNVDSYLRATYGNGASEKSYRNYLEVSALASSYLQAYSDSLEFTAQDLLDYQAKAPYEFNSYTYAIYELKVNSFLKGGTTTKDENGKETTTYSDEEKAAAVKAAEVAANLLAGGEYLDLEMFDKAIKALPHNQDNPTAASTKYDTVLYAEISSRFQDWLIGKVESDDEDAEPTFEERTEGQLTVIANKSGSGENEVINGYYVVRFGSVETNDFAMKDVRHVLIKFEGGKTDSTTGVTTYSDAEKAAAKEKAEKLLNEWKAAGDLSEDSFAELAKKNSKDGNAAQGGLYEKVYPGQMVENFENWLYDAERKVGDTGIVESPYGYHIMFFVGDNEQTFRDFMITNVKRNEDVKNWHNDLVEAMKLEVLTLKHIELDMVLSH